MRHVLFVIAAATLTAACAAQDVEGFDGPNTNSTAASKKGAHEDKKSKSKSKSNDPVETPGKPSKPSTPTSPTTPETPATPATPAPATPVPATPAPATPAPAAPAPAPTAKACSAEATSDACWTCCDPTGIDHATGDKFEACGGDPACEDAAVAGCLNDAVCAKAYSCYETSGCGGKP